VRAKFRENALLALGDEAVAALEDGVLALEEQDELRPLFSLLAAERVPA
jgi:hypothetical protein